MNAANREPETFEERLIVWLRGINRRLVQLNHQRGEESAANLGMDFIRLEDFTRAGLMEISAEAGAIRYGIEALRNEAIVIADDLPVIDPEL